MSWRPGRSVPTGAYPLTLVLLLGCGSDKGVVDAAARAPDGAATDASPDSESYLRPETRSGLAGGSVCDSGAQCLSGACTLGACSEWSHALRIGIDTTSAGANVRETVANFPLLVRLRATNFAFSEARSDGADIRFVDAGGQNLDHEIERWDSATSTAELWVLVPSIAADSSGNFISMYWGNPLATPTASSAPVFGAFTCVYHMNFELDGVTTRLADASGHANTGLVQNPSSATPHREGIAGPATALDGQGVFLATTTRLPNSRSVSISLWFRTTSTTRAGLAGFAGKQSGSDVVFDRAIWLDELGRLSFGVLHGGAFATVSSLVSFNDGDWHQVVARFAGSGQYLFADGESVADDQSDSGTDPLAGYWRFGEEPLASQTSATTDAAVPAGNFFAGSLDEIRVSTDEASDAWIRLAYATQRPDATAVSYRRMP